MQLDLVSLKASQSTEIDERFANLAANIGRNKSFGISAATILTWALQEEMEYLKTHLQGLQLLQEKRLCRKDGFCWNCTPC